MGKEDGHDNAAGCEIAGAFVLGVEYHAQESWEEGIFDFTQLLEGEIGCA